MPSSQSALTGGTSDRLGQKKVSQVRVRNWGMFTEQHGASGPERGLPPQRVQNASHTDSARRPHCTQSTETLPWES